MAEEQTGKQYEQGRTDSMGSEGAEGENKMRFLKFNRENTKEDKLLGIISRTVEAYKNNRIVTSKYNVITFLPLNLMVQFSKMANLYFLILTIMQTIPVISDSNGVPILAVPLCFVVGMSMIKDIFEDFKRHMSDNEENNRKVKVSELNSESFKEDRWSNIQVGQIIKVHEKEYFPCDMLILHSSLPKGICYVETKNLDGETNLKHKQAHKDIIKLAVDEAAIMREFKNAEIECEAENEFLYTFAGSLRFTDKDLSVPLDADQLCLRGSSLRNTDYIYGVAVYTGHDSKVMMNSAKSKPKFSRIEISMGRYIFMSIFIQAAVCFFAAFYTVIWSNFGDRMHQYYYLDFMNDSFI